MYLIGDSKVVTTCSACVPFVISQHLEQLVAHNFQTISVFEKNVQKLSLQESIATSVMGHLLDRFGGLISKVFFNNYHIELLELHCFLKYNFSNINSNKFVSNMHSYNSAGYSHPQCSCFIELFSCSASYSIPAILHFMCPGQEINTVLYRS